MLPGLIAAASPRSADAEPESGHFRTARSVAGAYTSASWLGCGLVFRLVEEWFSSNLGQIRHGAGAFDKFFQGGHDGGAGEEFAEEVDLAAKLIVRNGLNEFFGGRARHGVVLGDLRGRRAGDAKGFAFTGKLRH